MLSAVHHHSGSLNLTLNHETPRVLKVRFWSCKGLSKKTSNQTLLECETMGILIEGVARCSELLKFIFEITICDFSELSSKIPTGGETQRVKMRFEKVKTKYISKNSFPPHRTSFLQRILDILNIKKTHKNVFYGKEILFCCICHLHLNN